MKLRQSPFVRLVPFLLRRQTAPLALLGPLLLIGIGMQLLRPWPMKAVLDGLFFGAALPLLPEGVPDRNDPLPFLAACCAAVVLFAAVDAVAGYLQVMVAARCGQKAVQRIRSALVQKVQALDLAFHRRRGSGDLLLRVTGDVAMLREVLLTGLLDIARNALVVGGMLAVMFALDATLTLVALGVVPPLFLLVHFLTPSIRRAVRKQRESEGQLACDVSEALGALAVVQSFGLEQRAKERIKQRDRRSGRAGLRARRLEASLGRTAEILLASGVAVVIGLGSWRALAGRLTPGDLVVFASYVRGLYKPIRSIAARAARLAKAQACAQRVVEVLDWEPSVRDRPGARPAPPFRGAVSFENVRFRYHPDEPVLEGVDAAIAPGEKVALVGRSGAGKTTLALMVPRLHDPEEGVVRIDGHDVRDFTLASLRRQVGLVLQETVLLRGTIAENIAIARPDAPRARIEEAAERAGCLEFIRRLPRGLDTEVGERGATLSGGQARRISLARVLLLDPPIVLLDEPLTGVDALIERSLTESLLRALEGRTVLLIAHRFSALPLLDRILVLDGGRIAEQGRHDELLAAGGLYAKLHAARGELDEIGRRPAEMRR